MSGPVPARRCDTVVIGAGLAGLTAAAGLRAAGRDVVVLEARDRVGGRTYDVPLPGSRMRTELGGQFVGRHHRRMRDLVGRLGLELFPTHESGRQVISLLGRRYESRGSLPRLHPGQLLDAAMTFARLRAAWRRLPSSGHGSVDDLLRRWGTTGIGRVFVELLVEGVLAAGVNEVSAAHFLHYLVANGGVMVVSKTRGGAQQDRVAGGPMQISERLAAGLDDAVLLGRAVESIVQDGETVRIRTRTDEEFVAAHAVIAIPPALQARISYDPPLPSERAETMRALRQGDVMKFAVVYDTPWWRDRGFSGRAVSDESWAPVVYDNTPVSGRPGVLMVLAGGARTSRLREMAAGVRDQAIAAALVEHFGTEAASPRHVLKHDWTTDPWTSGCYGAFAPPGVWTGYGAALRQSRGRLHWAGAETAQRFPGYMEGAVESGERAAREIVDVTGGSPPTDA